MCVHVPGRSNFKIPVYKTVDYKQMARPRVDCAVVPVAPRMPTRVKMTSNDIKRFKNVPAKIDTSDPVPWVHCQQHCLEELIDPDGLWANARISGMVKSRSLGSQREIQEAIENKAEQLFQRIIGTSKPETTDHDAAADLDVPKKPDLGITPLRVQDLEDDMETLQISCDHLHDNDSHDDEASVTSEEA